MDDLAENATKLSHSNVLQTTQQNKTLVNSLIQTIDELNKEIQHASDKVRCNHDKALETAQEWRQEQLKSIEQRYMNQCNSIEERFDRLNSFEKDVRNRLATEAHQPLTDLNPTDETLVTVRQTLDSISQDLWQLRWNAASKDRKVSFIPS
jgi:chromosome segregation ATPase